MEVYIGFGNKWPEIRAGGYIIGGKPPAAIPNGDVLGPCLNYGESLSSGTVEGGTTITSQTAVRCTFRSVGVIDIAGRPGAAEILLVHTGSKVLARADVSPAGASVTVPARACRKVRSPGNPPR